MLWPTSFRGVKAQRWSEAVRAGPCGRHREVERDRVSSSIGVGASCGGQKITTATGTEQSEGGMSGSNIRGGELARVDAGTTKARQLHPDKWPRPRGMPLAKPPQVVIQMVLHSLVCGIPRFIG